MLIVAGLVLILALTIATGYFVAQEFAYVAVDRSRLQGMANDGDPAAIRALRVTERLSFMLSGAQLGITVTALLAGFVAEPFLGAGLADLLGMAGLSRAASLSISVGLALLMATVIQMVLGELAPKNLAIARPEALARRLSRSTLMYLTVAGPLIHLFDAAANRLLRWVGVEPVEGLPAGATPEELERIIAESEAGGHLDPVTSRLLDQGLDFQRRTADETMVPRVDVYTIRADEPAHRVVELLDTGHSRFPVLGSDRADDIVGVVGIADVMALPAAERATTPVADVASPPLLLPASLPLPAVLDRLRGAHRQLACVVDEYGGFAGVITLEDVAEELVGPIRDEGDLPELAPVRQPDGAWLVPARWRIDEVADATGIALPEAEEYDTVSGLILRVLGRIPHVGDHVEVELAAGVGAGDGAPAPWAAIEVISVARHVPHLVRLQVRDDAEDPV